MRAWLGRMIRLHLIADDPWPEYSRLDLQDGRLAAAKPKRRPRAKYQDETAGTGPENAAQREDSARVPGDSHGPAASRRKTEAASPAAPATDAAVPRST